MAYLIVSALIILIDQVFKFWIVQTLELREVLPLLPGIIHLTNVRNTGAAFSILADMRWLLIGLTSVCALGILIYLLKTKMGFGGKLSLAFVLGGAIGNIIDRASLGYVVDMFEVEFMEYAVFNIADCFIVVGGILFCIFYMIFSGQEEKAKKAKKQQKASGKKREADDVKQYSPKREKQPEPRQVQPIEYIDDSEEEWTETKILEEYDLFRRMSEDDR